MCYIFHLLCFKWNTLRTFYKIFTHLEMSYLCIFSILLVVLCFLLRCKYIVSKIPLKLSRYHKQILHVQYKYLWNDKDIKSKRLLYKNWVDKGIPYYAIIFDSIYWCFETLIICTQRQILHYINVWAKNDLYRVWLSLSNKVSNKEILLWEKWYIPFPVLFTSLTLLINIKLNCPWFLQ